MNSARRLEDGGGRELATNNSPSDFTAIYPLTQLCLLYEVPIVYLSLLATDIAICKYCRIYLHAKPTYRWVRVF